MRRPPSRKALSIIALLIGLVGLIELIGPVRSHPVGMADWDGGGATLLGYTLDGKEVRPRDFSGEFLWLLYDSEWCPNCEAATTEAVRVLVPAPQGIKFIVVLLAGKNPRVLATKEEAEQWALRSGIPLEQVLYGVPMNMVIPMQKFFAPDGRTLVKETGVIPAERISSIVSAAVNERGR